MYRLVRLLCITLIVAAGVAAPRSVRVSASAPSHPMATPTLPTGMKVDVGGYRLFIRCIGMGSPTVILDAALGQGMSWWDAVLPGVASFTRVCAYDRAGVEKSDPRSVHPGTSMVAVKELRILLAKAHVKGPYVLAGSANGGQNMRLYTYLHRTEVRGLVQIDGRVVDQCTRFGADLCPPVGDFEDMDLAASDVQLDTVTQGKTTGSLGTLPLVVLSDGLGFDMTKGADPLWDKAQAELASASSNSIHVIATLSDVSIPVIQPELVVEAIHEVVTAARSSSHTLRPCGQAFTRRGGKCVRP